MEPYLSYARAVHAHTRAVRASAGIGVPEADDIREVLLVLSASRGGSSLLYEMLSGHPGIVSVGGEHVPFYKLHGFDLDGGDGVSDAVRSFRPAAAVALGASVAAAVRAPAGPREPLDHLLFACDVVDRLAAQWSGAGVPADALLDAVTTAVDRCRKTEGAPEAALEAAPEAAPERAPVWDRARFLAALADALPGCSPGHPHPFDPAYIDGYGGHREPDAGGTGPRAPQGPPDPHYCVEEPPFVLPVPRAVPSAAVLRHRTLLLKASVDAYRLPLVSALFPRARLRIVHLTRNPAASVNGLYDGWLDRGFFSYDVSAHAALSISGYSGTGPWGTRWWNFDAPPGWQRLTSAPLAEVAAFQWSGAHGAILRALADRPAEDVLRIRFEDIIRSPRDRAAALDRIRRFAGLDAHPAATGPLPVVMATRPPGKQRWRGRREVVVPALTARDTPAVAAELGYPLGREEDWL